MNPLPIKVLMIDNFDSFTYNLVHYLQALDNEQLPIDVVVKRNNEISLEDITDIAPTHLIISPGPCTPNEAGISLKAIHHLKAKIPILGVCLGHQAIGQVFGAKVVKAKRIMHGKTSPIYHAELGVFEGLKQGFEATRYHSLVLDWETLPSEIEVTAWTQDEQANQRTIMGIRHCQFSIQGVQFHPESVLSEFGHQLLGSFLSC